MTSVDDAEAFRTEIRDFLSRAPKPEGLRDYGPTPTAADVESGRQWHRYLADHGYTCLHWPREHSGADAPVTIQAIFAEECANARVPRQLNITSVDLVGPVLIRFGTDQQKSRYLEAIRLGEHLWCQLFSKPEADSDFGGNPYPCGEDRHRLAHRRSEGLEFGGRLGGLWSPVGAYGPR